MSISDIIMLFSGIALFLFGMSLMGDGLKSVSGNKLEPVLFKLSGTPLRGILLGTGVTAVIQSSSATSVMAVGFVNSGMMKTRQAIYVILGSILGTSITGWVICLSYLDSSSDLGSLLGTATLTGIISVAGILLRMFAKSQTLVHVGGIMMGFAVLMFGMSSMSSAVSGLGEQEWFSSLIIRMNNPFMGILIGTFIAAVLQSASAAVGILQALSVTGVITYGAALPVLMGIAIGASVPVLLSALGAGIDGKRTAVSYLISNFMGVMVCASIFYICDAIFHFSFLNVFVDPFSTAMLNTLLRLVIVLLLAPFTDVVEAMGTLIVKDKHQKEKDEYKLEERFLDYPALAVEQTRRVISQMARESDNAVLEALELLRNYTQKGMEKVKELEDVGDRYEDTLGAYIMKISARELTTQQSSVISVFLHSLSDLERISDHALNIAENATEIHDKALKFSDEEWNDLSVLYSAVERILDLSVNSFIEEDEVLAKQVEPLEEVIDRITDQLKMRHVDRLRDGKSTITQGFVFNDLITNLERISDHCSNIAVAIIELKRGDFDSHEYLDKLKSRRLPEFERTYEHFLSEYKLPEIVQEVREEEKEEPEVAEETQEKAKAALSEE